MRHIYIPKGTCSTKIIFDKDENGIITNISFTGGCKGNLNAISKLLEGWKAEDICNVLKGNKCGIRSTSCADQLSIAVMQD